MRDLNPQPKTHLVPGSLFVSLLGSQTVFSLIVLSVLLYYCDCCVYIICSFGHLLLFRGFDSAFWFSIPPTIPLPWHLWIGCADIDFDNPTLRLAMWTVHKYIQTLKVKKEDLIGIAAVFESQNQVVIG
jgi:hypothetical protein